MWDSNLEPAPRTRATSTRAASGTFSITAACEAVDCLLLDWEDDTAAQLVSEECHVSAEDPVLDAVFAEKSGPASVKAVATLMYGETQDKSKRVPSTRG